jgi:hypothetical protein
MTNIPFSSYPFHPLIPIHSSRRPHPSPSIRPRRRLPQSPVLGGPPAASRHSGAAPAPACRPPSRHCPGTLPRARASCPTIPSSAARAGRLQPLPAAHLPCLGASAAPAHRPSSRHRPGTLPRAPCPDVPHHPPSPPSPTTPPLATPSRSLAVGHGGSQRSSSVSHGQRQRAAAALCHGPRPAGGMAGKGRAEREVQRAKLLFSAASPRFGCRERETREGRQRFGLESVFLVPFAQLCQKQLLKLLLKLCQRDPKSKMLSWVHYPMAETVWYCETWVPLGPHRPGSRLSPTSGSGLLEDQPTCQ